MGVAQIRKALLAAGAAALAILIHAAQAKGSLDTNDVVSAIVAGALAGVGVYYIHNAPVVTAPAAPASPASK